MTSVFNLAPRQLRQAANLKEEISALENELHKLLGRPMVEAPAPTRKKRRKMGAAARARMAAAARKRWKKAKLAGKNAL